MKLLVVEDNPDISTLIVMMLEQHQLNMFTEPEAVDDEDILRAEGTLVDFMLPRVNGCQFLERVAKVNPACRRILFTAAPPPLSCMWAHRVLHKPKGVTEIEAALYERRNQ